MYDPTEHFEKMLREAERQRERAEAFADFMLVLFFLVCFAAVPIVLVFG